MNCVHRPIPAGKKPTYMSFTDSIHVLDHFMVSRATNDYVNVGAVATADTAACMPQGTMATIVAAIVCVPLLPVTVILGAANEIEVFPKLLLIAVNTTSTLVAMSKRRKVFDAALLVSAAASKKSRTTKGKEPPINLCQYLTYAVTNNCMKHCVHAITHGRKWVTGNARTFAGSIANEPLSNH